MSIVFYIGIALTGAVMALFGGGGAMLCIPLLVYVGGYDPKQAIATGLVIVYLSSLVSLARYGLRTSYVDYKLGFLLAILGTLGAFFGVRVYEVVPARVALICFASLMLGISYLMNRMRAQVFVKRSSRRTVIGAGGGALLVGFVTGALGASGGLPLVALCYLFLGLSMKESIATGLLVVVFNVSAALFFQYNVHHFDFLNTQTWIAVLVAATSALFCGFFFEKIKSELLTKAFAVFVAWIALIIIGVELLK